MASKEHTALPLEQWKDCEKLFKHMGADVSRKNDRLRISINGRFAIFHCQSTLAEIDMNSIVSMKKFLEYVGEHAL